eukprot:COSAG01_NODE_70551_length_258_cov_0.654088_1_plen_65_part_01
MSAPHSTLTGATSGTAGTAVQLTVQLRDEFGNAADGSSALLAISDSAGVFSSRRRHTRFLNVTGV